MENIEKKINEPEIRNEEGITLCSRAWEIFSIPGIWMYAEKCCMDCEGYNSQCRYYRPLVE
jgi:hypothetical protein